MPENTAIIHRKQHFTDNWLAWAVLHHFLPAPLLRELSYIIVDKMSIGSISLDQLFVETYTDELSELDSWLVQPRETDSQLATYLQYCIRAFTWQNDPGSFGTPEEHNTSSDVISPIILDKAIGLGAADFSSAENILKGIPVTIQPSFNKLVETFRTVCVSFSSSNRDDVLMVLESQNLPIEMPLFAVVLKHFGDLCADADAWDRAQVLYDRAARSIAEYDDPSWNEFSTSLHAIITQSSAAATRTIRGTEEAAKLLATALDSSKMPEDLLMLANASYDAFVASMHSFFDQGITRDRRSALLQPPLLHNSHNLSAALKLWQNSKFNDAHRHFWAVLRRQIALGSATESRETKAFYARSIFDDVDQKIARQSQPESFNLALRLLLESGNSKAAVQMRWNEQIVDTYVDQQCVDFVVAHAQAHLGSLVERQSIIIELFREWIVKITPARIDVVASMLRYITMLALEPSTFSEQSNLGGRSLEALECIAHKRPELRYSNASEVATAISKKLRMPGFWTGRKAALDTALAYADIFPVDSLREVINSILEVLDETRPETDMWPIVRPALNLLTTEPVKRLSGQVPDLGHRIVSTILHFGLNQESEQANVLFYLHNFDSALLRDSSVRDTLQGPITSVRRKSSGINSSNVVENIRALLLAPAVSGIDGVKDALNGLTLILSSAVVDRPSIALPVAYDPLLLLADRYKQIASDISISPEEFCSWLQPLVPLIIDLWTKAKEYPQILASFSFSEVTKPDPVIVHNWAYASTIFSEWIGQNNELQEAITAAALNPVLANGIALARATRSSAEEGGNIDINAVREENRDAFYSALGRRLVVLQRLDIEQGHEACKALLDQCICLGPRELDAAVFLSAIHLNLSEYVSQTSLSDYMKRVEDSRDLRLALAPILHMFKNSAGNVKDTK